MSTCPDAVKRLIEKFNQQYDQVRAQEYNETTIRIEYINPLMTELGWDMDNRQGYAEQYREVVHEDRVKVAGQTKAPDYSFRIGGQRKFFLEAKKPFVHIKTSPEPAYQLRRYAWSAKLAVSILTDFEEFAIYDARIQPKLGEKASIARREFISYTDFESRWDFLSGTFSKEAVLRGDFDRYCATKKGRGAQEFDDAFLAEIEEWRKDLASNLALRNDNLDEAGLNFAVQRIIDRIIFLRMAEDRGTEDHGQLKKLLEHSNIYSSLNDLFRQADDRYNSGLFHFEKESDRDEAHDTLTPKLKVDDKTLKTIIKALYYPESPYEFTMVSADILGSIYERFLGKVITLTAGHRAKIEEKPEVRKAGGVYYTPTYIVDYIVQNTVGKLLDGKTPKEAAKIRVLDPACGSGSFLIGAYQFLLDWYLQQYTATDPDKLATGKNPVLRPGPDGSWRLTSSERKRILLDHIHGVDLDGAAVEVTKLNLLLKCLEGETSQSLGFQQRLIRERALPDLGHNILCGNSLIGTDIIGTEAWNAMDDDERARVNPFDYERAFPHIFKGKDAGFDAVIGNPPWGADINAQLLSHCSLTLETARSRDPDTYSLFIERIIHKLKDTGKLGYITPDTFLRKDTHESFRAWLLASVIIQQFIELGPVFSKVRDTWCLISILERGKIDEKHTIEHLKLSRFIVSAEERLNLFEHNKFDSKTKVRQYLWLNRPQKIVAYLANEITQRIINNIEKHPTLNEQSDNYVISRGEEGSKFNIHEVEDGDFQMVIPDDVERYKVGFGRCINSSGLASGKIQSIYRHAKIWVIRIQKMRWKQRIVSGIDFRLNSAAMKTLQSIVCPTDDNSCNRLKYLQALLASRLINFWCINYLADDMNRSYLGRLPVPHFETNVFTKHVDTMLSLHKKLADTEHPQKREQIQREIDATDRQIDQLVYELYGLTDDEIRIVEEATA